MADIEEFEFELMTRLRHSRMLFVTEIFEIGKKYGLTESQARRVVEQAALSEIGFFELAFVLSGD